MLQNALGPPAPASCDFSDLPAIETGVQEVAFTRGEEEEEEDEEERDDEPGPSQEEQEAAATNIRGYLASIQRLASSASERLAGTLQFSLSVASQEERDTFEELLEEYLRDDDDFHDLVDGILDDAENRFELLTVGTLNRGAGGWPVSWTFNVPAPERTEFIRRVNRFSGNQAHQFGTLLTPLVEGIRVRGPFAPSWHRGAFPKLVLMDGEGLNHGVSANQSLSTRITKRYQEADVILLVDNAQQPMLAAPNAALESIAAN